MSAFHVDPNRLYCKLMPKEVSGKPEVTLQAFIANFKEVKLVLVTI